jgi:hypothetical protein
MRSICLLLLLGLAACANSGPPPPCNPPMFIDSTGECVSSPIIERRR